MVLVVLFQHYLLILTEPDPIKMCNFKLTMVKVHHLEDTNLPSTTVHQGKLKVTEHVHRVGNLYLRKDDDGLPWMLVNALQVMVAGGSLRKIPGTQACYELTTKQGTRLLPTDMCFE